MSAIVEKVTYSYCPQPISWGAISAGVIFTCAVSWLLFTFGSAIGISLMEPFDISYMESWPEKNSDLGIGILIWTFVSSLGAFCLGGLLTGRLTGKPDRAVGMLHGVTLWSAVVIVSLILSLFGVGGVTKTALGVAKSSLALSQTGLERWSKNELVPKSIEKVTNTVSLEVLKVLRQLPSSDQNSISSNPAITNNNFALDVAVALVRGDTGAAHNILAQSTVLSESQIDNIIKLSLPVAIESAQKIEKKIKSAQDYLTGILWLVFVSSCGALLAAILGSYLGVGSVARIYSYTLY